MNKIIWILFCVLGVCLPAQSQKNKKDRYLNWVVLVNEKLHESNINGSAFILKMKDSTTQTIKAWAYTGDIRLSQKGFDKIQSSEVVKLWFWFSTNGVNIKRQAYKIRVDKSWLKARFVVLKVYSLHKRKYRRMFKPTKDNKKYVYEIDLPHKQIIHPKQE